MKILFIDQYAALGGGQRVLLQMIQAAVENRLDATLLAPAGGDLEITVRRRHGAAVQFAELHESRFSAGKKTAADALKLAVSVFRLLRHLPRLSRADTIYVNGPRLYFAACLLSCFFPGDYYYHVHLDHSSLEKRLIRWIARHPRTRKIVLSSRFLYDRLLQACPSLAGSGKL